MPWLPPPVPVPCLLIQLLIQLSTSPEDSWDLRPLIDSGADKNFIDCCLAHQLLLELQTLPKPCYEQALDGHLLSGDHLCAWSFPFNLPPCLLSMSPLSLLSHLQTSQACPRSLKSTWAWERFSVRAEPYPCPNDCTVVLSLFCSVSTGPGNVALTDKGIIHRRI